MTDGLLAQIEREVLGWPGVSKETGGGGRGRNGFGHVHHNEEGLADFSFPKEVREGLIRSGRVVPHPAFPDSLTDASYQVRSTEDVPGVVELFKINYERAVARDARHATRTSAAATHKEAT